MWRCCVYIALSRKRVSIGVEYGTKRVAQVKMRMLYQRFCRFRLNYETLWIFRRKSEEVVQVDRKMYRGLVGGIWRIHEDERCLAETNEVVYAECVVLWRDWRRGGGSCQFWFRRDVKTIVLCGVLYTWWSVCHLPNGSMTMINLKEFTIRSAIW